MKAVKVSKKDLKQNQLEVKQLRKLASTVGDFIRYWGFRRIHGQIWTEIYLSNEPLSGKELTDLLLVSKALISPALSELQAYNLIQPVPGDGKTKKYVANPNVFSVIREVLQKREKILIQTAQLECEKLREIREKNSQSVIPMERLTQIHEMIISAQQGIDLLLMMTDTEGTGWLPL